MYAHASGFNWDEGILVFAPIALVSCLLLWVRRKEMRDASTSSSAKVQR